MTKRRRPFGVLVPLTDFDLDFANRKAELIANATRGHDGTVIYGKRPRDTYWISRRNNFQAACAEVAFAIFADLNFPRIDATPSGMGDGGIDFTLSDGTTVDVKSASHDVVDEIQIFRGHWPLRSELFVAARPVPKQRRLVVLRGWATREAIEESVRKGCPANHQDWEPQWWFPAAILCPMWSGPWNVTVWPPDDAKLRPLGGHVQVNGPAA